MKKNLINGVAVFAIGVLSLSSANAADIRYRQSGDWSATAPLNTGAGWQNVSAVPTTADMGIINWASNTVTVSTTETIGKMRVGQDQAGALVISSSGTLTTVNGSGQNGDFTLGQGNNAAGTGLLTVDSDGTLNVQGILYNGNKADGTANISGTVNVTSHLWTGWNSGFTGIYNVNDGGELNVTGQLGLNWEGTRGTGIININDGGAVNLSQIHATGNSIMGDSKIVIDGNGKLTKTSNFTAVIQQYIDDGFIVGANGETVSVNFDGSNTVVTIPEPATIGLIGLFGGGMLFLRRRFSI